MNIFDIPIITYHKISPQKEFGLTTISPHMFKKQMQFLFENGYQTITFNQYDSGKNLPEKPIIISFDDTYRSVYENAFAIMKEFNFLGLLLVISDYMGKRNDWEAYPVQRKYSHANKDEIAEMLKYGFEIGTHSATHRYLPHQNKNFIENEFVESKKNLEKTFTTNIFACCYPYGGYNDIVIKCAREAGYRYGMGNLKIASKDNTNSLCLQRRSIYSTDSISAFINKVTNPSKFNLNFATEWLIQKGAFAGILKNKFV